MTPEAFISKWSQSATRERAASQEHFIDLCRLLDERTPNEADPEGSWYAFEKGTQKTGAGRGWADVWKRGCFGWEYKGKGRDLAKALQQLQLYALALESPPLLIVSDIETIEIHTAFQNAVQEVHRIRLADLAMPEARQKLRWAFSEPERLCPTRTRFQITEEAAGKFAGLAFELRKDGHEPNSVAHFLNKMLFCMFAEDAGLLPHNLFTRAVERGVEHPEHVDAVLKGLFRAMQTGGTFGSDFIEWFNGGLFDNDETLPLSLVQIRTLRDLAHMDWSQMEPAIFGTLFERGLDPSKRSQLGAHYTDPGSIMRLVNPTIVEPLLEEWEQIKTRIAETMVRFEAAKTKPTRERIRKAAQKILQEFLERLKNFRILDPACGSGNFLYLALQALKDIEHRVILEAEALGLQRSFPSVGPESVHGIEMNSYAAELARVTVWIGEIQWMLSHGYSLSKTPILKPLDTIEERDALIAQDGAEAHWPRADVIIGNPPFLGTKKQYRELGKAYTDRLRSRFKGRVPGFADLVCYWFEKAGRQMEANAATRVGLVATNSIRGGRSRDVLEDVSRIATIYNAWSDEPWVNEGAAVRVSLICFSKDDDTSEKWLDGQSVSKINPNLTDGPYFPAATRLVENKDTAFVATVKAGPFDVPGDLARQWLLLPNPHGKPNSDVLRPWANGMDVTRRPSDTWIIDFGVNMPAEDAALYEQPFAHVLTHVRTARDASDLETRYRKWWLMARPIPNMRRALDGLPCYIATPVSSKHRVFVRLDSAILADHQLVVIARDGYETFGVLQSRFHELWSLEMCTWLGVGNDPRYTPTTTFDTFPFPDGLTPNLKPHQFSNPYAKKVAEAAEELDQLRTNWLNPAAWIERVPEIIPGYPERVVAKAGHEDELKERTLTKLYNSKPAWLVNAHRNLDQAVAAAYGWPGDTTDQEALERLLELNLDRARRSIDPETVDA